MRRAGTSLLLLSLFGCGVFAAAASEPVAPPSSARTNSNSNLTSTEASAASPERDWTKERAFWSFQAPRAPTIPKVHFARWPRSRLDYFTLARMEAAGLSPALEAGKRTLVRRVTLDLTGLPPSPAEMDALLRDGRSDAYARWVETLLESKRFGEHLASLWLPLARYAEDQAHQVGDDTKYFYPNAWRYRSWVIDAFNRDLPYDRFLALQLAADRIEGSNSLNLAALGFLGLGPKYYNRDRIDVQADEWEDRVDTVCRAMLGLTVACARCHDHKFDPISMRDYYGLAGIFASTRMVNRLPDGTAEKNEATNMSSATLHVVEDSNEPHDLPVFLRGNVDRKGPMAARGFIQILSLPDGRPFTEGSGRKELAGAIASDRNPLTARVMVNRVWAQFFGQPLVATASNFGHSGQPPACPELLDDLAVRFMQNGWSVKWLVRELALSATYRQATSSSAPFHGSVASARIGTGTAGEGEGASPGAGADLDPANEKLARMNRRRLTIEQWRDTVLFLTGELKDGDGRSLELDDPANDRRTVYARISRLKLNDLLMQFDYPDPNVHAEKRGVTTTAIQKLFFLNSPFMQERAQALVARLQPAKGAPRAADVGRVYQWLFNRDPSREEARLARDFLERPAAGTMTRWEEYAQLLLASNELLYVD